MCHRARGRAYITSRSNLLPSFHIFITTGHSRHLSNYSITESTRETFLKSFIWSFSNQMLSSSLRLRSLFIFPVITFTNSSPCWQASNISMDTSNFLCRISWSTWSCKILDFFYLLCILLLLNLPSIASRHSTASQFLTME